MKQWIIAIVVAAFFFGSQLHDTGLGVYMVDMGWICGIQIY